MPARLTRLAAALLLAAPLSAPAQSRDSLSALARARLSRIEGSLRVAGLDSAVEVRRDRWGVPHIYARTQHDLFFAQGFVAAQDRLWQREIWRRTGQGRLAEVIGAAAVERDRFARLLRYRGDMTAEWTSYAPDTRAIATAFTDGINAWVRAVRDRPPVEYELAGIRPTEWRPEDVLNRMAALAMTGNALSEMDRARLVAVVGAERAAQLWPPDPARALDPAPGLDLSDVSAASLGAALDAYGPVAFARREGSNNWVVSGAKTATGKPLLANDPHRAVMLPALRYLSHLVGPGWNVIGAGEPALPGIAAGHNERVAFGFTIVGMDQQDVYVERVRTCPRTGAAAPARSPRPRRCWFNAGSWKPIREIVDTIRVKGERARVVTLAFTDHGPIVAEDTASGRAFVVRFVGSEPGTAGYLANLSIARAHDWPSFRAAAERWKLPTENLIYADTAGNIGWVAAGLMPKRSWSGLLPVPGDGSREWEGFLPMRELPMVHNPADGVIATANHNILPPGYPHALSHEWDSPFRANRIGELLRAGRGFTRADFERLQHDEYSVPASRLVPILLHAAAAQRDVSSEADLLRGWDFVMHRDSAAPLVYEAWLGAYARRVHTPLAGAAADVVMSGWDLAALVRASETADTAFFPAGARQRDSVMVVALAEARDTIVARLGADRSRWRWGAVHVLRLRHPLAAAFDLEPVSRGGDPWTINSTSGPAMSQTHGASFREVIDLADWDNSTATSAPGQSGQPGSPPYADLLPLWAEGRYFPLVYSRRAVEAATAHVLILTPR